MAINYKNSKVYKIWSPQGEKIYIGSTTKELLCQRMTAHRKDYKGWKKTNNKFMSSFLLFEEYGLENCFIELLQEKVCNSKDELRQLEGKYIREQDCLNKRIAGQTKREYYEDNKEDKKQYYEHNKEKISERQKLYRENNKEKISECQKQYRDNNKEILSQYQSQEYNCECGCKVTQKHKARHFKTIKHCQFIEQQNNLTEPLM